MKKQIAVTVSEDLWEAVKKHGKKTGRTISGLIEVLLREYMDGLKNEK